MSDIRVDMLEMLPNDRVHREEAYETRLVQQVVAAAQDVAAAQRRYDIVLTVCRVGGPDVVVAAAVEVAEARDDLARVRGKTEKLERELAEVRDRLARWRALLRWANR